MATTTHTHNSNRGGNAADRRRMLVNLMRHWGDGTYAACVYCGLKCHANADADGGRQDDTLTRDRIIPGADGGRYIMKNLAPACYDCNRDRGDMPLADYCGPEHAARIMAIAGEYRRGGPTGPR